MDQLVDLVIGVWDELDRLDDQDGRVGLMAMLMGSRVA